MSVEYVCVYVLYVLSWAGRQAQMNPTRGATGRSGSGLASWPTVSFFPLPISWPPACSPLLRLPGDPVVCGPVGFLSLVWPTGKCQQSMSPLSTPTYLALHQAGWGLLHQRGDSGSEDLLSLQWSSPSLPKRNDNTFPCPLRSVPHYFLWVFSQGDWQEALGWLFTSDILLILLKTFLKMMAFHVFRDQSGPLT